MEDMSEKTFSQHNGSVFCVAISKSEEYVLTGGEDDLAYVWKISGSSNHNPCCTLSMKLRHIIYGFLLDTCL